MGSANVSRRARGHEFDSSSRGSLDCPSTSARPKARSDAHATAPGANSAGPPGPAKVLPGTALRVALGMQDLGTRILRGVELKNHPFWIWNPRIRRCVELPDVVVRQPKVYGADVVFELLGFPGGDDDAAHRWPTEHPCDRHLRRTGAMPCGHFLERIHDVVAHLSVERH